MTELMADPRFEAAAKGIFTGLVTAMRGGGHAPNANIAIDALAFVQAAFLEAHPEAKGLNGLKSMTKLANEDLAAFLEIARAQFDATGRHMLETMSGPRS